MKTETMKQKLAQKLTYDGQLEFKRFVGRNNKELGINHKGDFFYFDYVTGVDAETSRDIPGLMANGSMTWCQAVDVLKKHF